MSIRQQLGQLLWQHGVANDALLDALDWKMRKIMTDELNIPAPWVTEIERLREALGKIAEVEEFRHNSGVYDYRPALDASTMQEIALEALKSGASS